MDNTHLRMERVEDCLDVLPEMCHCPEMYGFQSRGAFLEVQNLCTQLLDMNLSLLVNFERNNTIINKKFTHLDEDMEKVVGLVGEKIEASLGSSPMNSWRRWRSGTHVGLLWRRGWLPLEGIVVLFTGLLSSIQQHVGELKDAVMEELDAVTTCPFWPSF